MTRAAMRVRMYVIVVATTSAESIESTVNGYVVDASR
jgi:hypothetical protein